MKRATEAWRSTEDSELAAHLAHTHTHTHTAHKHRHAQGVPHNAVMLQLTWVPATPPPQGMVLLSPEHPGATQQVGLEGVGGLLRTTVPQPYVSTLCSLPAP